MSWVIFLAARWRGLVVERFGIWFGKPLLSVNTVVSNTALHHPRRILPLPQMAPMEAIEGKGEEVPKDLSAHLRPGQNHCCFCGAAFQFWSCLCLCGHRLGRGQTCQRIGHDHDHWLRH